MSRSERLVEAVAAIAGFISFGSCLSIAFLGTGVRVMIASTLVSFGALACVLLMRRYRGAPLRPQPDDRVPTTRVGKIIRDIAASLDDLP